MVARIVTHTIPWFQTAIRIRVIAVAAVDALPETITAQLDGFLTVRRVAEAVVRHEAAVRIVAVAAVDALPETITSGVGAARTIGERFALAFTGAARLIHIEDLRWGQHTVKDFHFIEFAFKRNSGSRVGNITSRVVAD